MRSTQNEIMKMLYISWKLPQSSLFFYSLEKSLSWSGNDHPYSFSECQFRLLNLYFAPLNPIFWRQKCANCCFSMGKYALNHSKASLIQQKIVQNCLIVFRVLISVIVEATQIIINFRRNYAPKIGQSFSQLETYHP